jgi:hypothetical protein
MKQYFELDPCPVEEDGAQVGHGTWLQLAAEARRFKLQILAAYPPVNERCRVSIHWNSHDFGSYPEIRIWWDDSDEPSMEWAFKIEEDAEEKLIQWSE